MDSRKRSLGPAEPERRRRAIRVGTTLVLVLMCGLLAGAWIYANSGVTYETALHESRIARLSDGTRVRLNGGSRVRAVFSAEHRVVEVRAGDARFEVAPDALRPFVVKTARADVFNGRDFRVVLTSSLTVTSYGSVLQVVARSENGQTLTLYVEPGETVTIPIERTRAAMARRGSRGCQDCIPLNS